MLQQQKHKQFYSIHFKQKQSYLANSYCPVVKRCAKVNYLIFVIISCFTGMSVIVKNSNIWITQIHSILFLRHGCCCHSIYTFSKHGICCVISHCVVWLLVLFSLVTLVLQLPLPFIAVYFFIFDHYMIETKNSVFTVAGIQCYTDAEQLAFFSIRLSL